MSRKEKSLKAKKQQQPVKKDSGLHDSDHDEVDHFHAKKDQILFEEADGYDEDEQGPDTILDLPSEDDPSGEDDYDDDDQDYFENDSEDSNSEEYDQDKDWGKGRKNYYSGDHQVDGDEETKLAERLHQKKMASFDPEDFGIPNLKSTAEKVIVKSVSFSDIDDESPIDSKELEGIEAELDENLKMVNETLKPFMEKMKQLPRSEGLSFLQTKYNLLLHYCINAVYYVKAKAEGRKLKPTDLVIERLVKYRLLLEKMKPMEAKLKHQIDRLLEAAYLPEEQVLGDELKPRIDLIEPDAANGEDVDQEQNQSGKYKPPKSLNVEMVDKKAEKLKARQSRIQEELEREQLVDDDLPEEEDVDPVKTMKSNKKKSAITGSNDRIDDVEEENFVRFQLSKKDKRRLAEETKIVDGLDDLNDMFDEFDRRRRDRGGSEDDDDKLDEKISRKDSKKRVKVADEDEEIESSEDDDDDGGDAYYKEQVKRKQDKRNMEKNKETTKKDLKKKAFTEEAHSGPRPASRDILKNRGLTPHRNRDLKNPRVKQRVKYERAQKRISSFKPVARQSRGPYHGEDTGIRTNLTRSMKFK